MVYYVMIFCAYALHIKNVSIYDLSIKTNIALNARQDTDTEYWSLWPLLSWREQ